MSFPELGHFLLGVCMVGVATAAEWTPETNGRGFEAGRSQMLVPSAGVVSSALVLRFPWGQPSDPGEYAQWSTTAEFPEHRAALTFYWSDDFAGPTEGYHFLQILIDDRLVWERDVAHGSDLAEQRVPIPDGPRSGRVAVRLYDKKGVKNFGVTVRIAGIAVAAGDARTALLPLAARERQYRELPPDLPLPALPATTGWTRNANIIQPWGRTQSTAMHEADEWAPRLARDFGFDAIIMLPPGAHNRVSEGQPPRKGGVTEDAFQDVLAAYRNVGMKIVIYTSVMHVGHAPEWQFGRLARERPEWSQRDRDGGVITTYGHDWLCPATGALDYTLDYTAELVRRYDADAVMLDNNEFLKSNDGKPTCYCKGCQRRFRSYILSRFGEAELKELLGLGADDVQIPADEEHALWGLWLSWRKRIWAEALETFRVALRKIKPDVVVLANTQYLHKSWLLAVDKQYAHEDAVLSESRGHDGAGMAAKMTLGRALATGRPLWNYIGTFREEDFTLLRPPARIRSICAASMGSGANPWIVFYGFTGEANRASVRVLTEYMAFWHEHAELLAGGREAARVGVVFSPETRDFTGRRMPPSWLEELLGRSFAVRGVWEPSGCAAGDIDGLDIAIAPACCMRQRSARNLAAWVRQGGTLITTPWTAWADQYGRYRDRPALARELGVNVSVPGEHVLDKGRVICLADEAEVPAQVAGIVKPDVGGAAETGVFRRVSSAGRQVLAIVGFDGNIGSVTVHGVRAAGKVSVYAPGQAERSLTPTAAGDLTLAVPEALAVLAWDATTQ